MDNWEKLNELVSQNQFELLAGEDQDLRLVYLMNDAVESFLIFRNASMTGKYVEDFEGEIWIEHTQSDVSGERAYIIVHQEDNVVTIFFDRLDFAVYLFDYSQVGHFWVKGYEYLRQLEFKIAILEDKYTYIGEEACTETEKYLSALYHFPPLSYCCYPAVSEAYIVPRKDVWKPSEDAIAVMRELALQVNDKSYARWLVLYRWMPTRWMTKILAGKLHQTRHIAIVKKLMECFTEGCAPYPARYALKKDQLQQKINAAKEKLKRLQDQQKDAELFIEEAFWFASDGLEGKVYLGIWNYGQRDTILEVEEV